MKQCPLCHSLVPDKELENDQQLCEICRLILEAAKEGDNYWIT